MALISILIFRVNNRVNFARRISIREWPLRIRWIKLEQLSSYGFHLDPHDRAAFDAHWKRIMDSTGIVKKTILRGEEVAGHISCYPQEGELEVTYWLGKKHWGKGVATQALKKLLQEITHRPLFARAAKDNIRSIRVLQKCDFKIIDENKDFAQGRGEETEEYIFRLDGEIQ